MPGLSVITSGSPAICFVLVLPSCVIYPPLPILSHQFGYSGRSSRFRIHLSVVPNFFPCLRGFRELLLPFASVFPVCPSFCFARLSIVTCGSPFLLSFRLIRSRFCASNAFLAIRLPVLSSSLWFFSSIANFRFRFFSPTGRSLLRLLVCSFCLDFQWSGFSFLFILYLSVSLPMFRLLFLCDLSFMRHFVGCLAILSALHVRRPFSFSSCSFSVVVFLPLRWLPAEISGCCSLFYYPVRFLSHTHFGFLRFCLFLSVSFRSLPSGFRASSLVPLGNFQVLFGFRGSSSVTPWSSCLVMLLFSPGLLCSKFSRCLVCLWDLILCRCSYPLRRDVLGFALFTRAGLF